NSAAPETMWLLFRAGFVHDPGGIRQLPSRRAAEEFMVAFLDSNRRLQEEFGIRLSLDKKAYPSNAKVQYLSSDMIFTEISKIIDKLMTLHNPHRVNTVRDAAIALEEVDLQKAHDLMAIAYEMRPGGAFI